MDEGIFGQPMRSFLFLNFRAVLYHRDPVKKR
jgi:hypothetical protein